MTSRLANPFIATEGWPKEPYLMLVAEVGRVDLAPNMFDVEVAFLENRPAALPKLPLVLLPRLAVPPNRFDCPDEDATIANGFRSGCVSGSDSTVCFPSIKDVTPIANAGSKFL